MKLQTAIIWIMVLSLALFGCNSSDNSATQTPEPEPTSTLLPTPEPTEELSDEPAITAEPDVVFFMEGYGIAVTNLNMDNFNSEMGDPPEGFKWVEITATLSNENEEGEAVTVDRRSLALIDASDNRYIPEEPDEFTQPPLVDAEINLGEFYRGFVRFAIPEDSVPTRLEWCLDENCLQVIQSFVNTP